VLEDAKTNGHLPPAGEDDLQRQSSLKR
jgi:hypothetical protein